MTVLSTVASIGFFVNSKCHQLTNCFIQRRIYCIPGQKHRCRRGQRLQPGAGCRSWQQRQKTAQVSRAESRLAGGQRRGRCGKLVERTWREVFRTVRRDGERRNWGVDGGGDVGVRGASGFRDVVLRFFVGNFGKLLPYGGEASTTW